MGLLNMGPQDEALLTLGLGLLNSKGSFGNALGQAGMQSLQTLNQAKERQAMERQRALQEQMQQMQVQQMQQKLAEQQKAEAFRASLQSPQQQNIANALGGGGGPTLANAAKLGPADPHAEMMFGAMQAGLLSPVDYIKAQQKDTSPIPVKEGEALLDRKTYKPIFTNQKQDKGTSDIQEFNFAQARGEVKPGTTFTDWLRANKASGATKIGLSVSTEKQYGEKFAGAVAASDLSLKEAADRAPELANRAIRVKQILNSGSPITGIGADFRLQASKALSALGIQSSGNAAADTETLSTQLAANTLDQIKASGLGGGTGFSNADRDFLEKAVGGRINLEKATLNRLADLSHRAAQLSAKRWGERARQIPKSAIEGTGISTAPVDIPALPDAGSDGWSIRPK